MIVVAFLQNQWFQNPDAVRAMYARNPARREQLNKRFLFAGCLTGRRLQAAFGDLCERIIWEETSPEIGGESSAKFPPDSDHIRRVLEKHRPDIVLLFGRNAVQGVVPLWDGPRVEYPHPAARTVTARDLENWLPWLQKEVQP